MPDRFDHDPVARLEAAKAAHRSMFDVDPTPGPRTTAIEDVLIAQLVELWQDRPEQRVGGAVAIAHEALEATP